MIDSLFIRLSEAMSSGLGWSLLASFGWGVLSILLSPCHLASIPLIVGYVTAQGVLSSRHTFSIAFFFAFGILITIAAIGVVTAALGRMMGDIGSTGNYIVAAVYFFIGLYLIDVLKLPWSGGAVHETKNKGLMAALVIGLLFGLAVGPCTFAYMAPVLGVVFQTAQSDFLNSISLLSAFGIGHCAVIVTAGSMSQAIRRYLNWSEKSGAIIWLRRVCGVLVIIAGIYLVFSIE